MKRAHMTSSAVLIAFLVGLWGSQALAGPQGDMGEGTIPPAGGGAEAQSGLPGGAAQSAAQPAPAPRPAPAPATGASADSDADQQAGIQPEGIWAAGAMGYGSSMGASGSSFGSVVLGYKMKKLTVGAVFSIGYAHSEGEGGMGTDSTVDSFGIGLGPRVEFILAQFGSTGLYVGGEGVFVFGYHKAESGNDSSDWKTYGFGLRGGLGGRYYLGGRVGLGLELGLGFSYSKDDSSDSWTLALGPYTVFTTAFIW